MSKVYIFFRTNQPCLQRGKGFVLGINRLIIKYLNFSLTRNDCFLSIIHVKLLTDLVFITLPSQNLSCVLSPVSCVFCPASCVLCPMSCVLCLVSCVLCPVSCILCLKKKSPAYRQDSPKLTQKTINMKTF